MNFLQAHKQVQALGFGLRHAAAHGGWEVLRGPRVVHRSRNPAAAVAFCKAWAQYVK